MGLEEFGDLPFRLEDWKYETVEYLVKKYEFEPGTFDYKDVLNPIGSDRNSYIASIRRTACSMANSGGGLILFGVKDRGVAVAALEDRITGIPIGGDLLREFGNKIEAVQPEIYFEAVPHVLPLPTDLSRGVFVVSIPQSQRRPHMDSNGIEICFTYGVKVVTPNPWRTGIDFVYDFSIPWHVDKFRRKCEEAWNYIENHIGRMLAARDELAMAGYWACGNLPIGYLVDRREMVGGQKNPLYRKYIPYHPHACVICWLFERYRELARNANELFQEISRREYLFPAFDTSIDEELVSRFRLKRVLDVDGHIKGYTLASVSGLRSILSNPAYAGYWVYKGAVVKGDNHEAIVDFGTFLYAFNRLSPTNLDGTPNESYLERRGQYMKKHHTDRPALLKNHLTSGNEGYTIYTQTFPLQGSTTVGSTAVAYAFFPKTSGIRGAAYMIQASEVDSIFLERFIFRLQKAEGFDNFLDHDKAEQEARMQLQADIDRDIKAVQSLMAKLLVRLTAITGEDTDQPETDEKTKKEQDETERELVREIKRAYKGHKEELARLQARQQEVATSFNQAEVRRTYKQLMQDAGDAWEEVVTPDELPLMIDAFVKKVVLTSLSPRFFKISIHWFDPEWGIDERVCFKGGNPSLHWKEGEDAILREHYPKAPRGELMRRLPTRSYTAMKGRASTLRVRRAIVEKGEQLTWTFCLRDLQIMEQYSLTEEQLRQGGGANLPTWSASLPY